MSGVVEPEPIGLFGNPVFLSAVFSLVVAQFIKAIINLFTYPSRSFKEVVATFLWRTGGMPSSHSSLAVALATAIGFKRGFGSDVFVLALFFALIVIRDAMGVRRSAGVQARALNQLGKALQARLGIAYHPVKEVQGHSPAQVVVGAFLGFFIALAFSTI